MLIKIGFTLNKLYILGVALKEQFFKNLQRFTKARNRDLFLATKISSFILTLEYKKASIPRRVI
jgi:hypothetical protein